MTVTFDKQPMMSGEAKINSSMYLSVLKGSSGVSRSTQRYRRHRNDGYNHFFFCFWVGARKREVDLKREGSQ